ncbi:MAG: hypothetical protein MMC23_001085 [Stictis urceolatum]|nr:hypothetical protein [Stictis urceolata]
MSNVAPTPDHTSSTPNPQSSTPTTSTPLTFDFATAAASRSTPPAVDNEDATRSAERAQKARRLTFLEDLVRNLDILIYAHLSAIYYMDTLLPLLIMRLLPQWLFFTPKPIFLPLPPTNRPYLAGLMFPFTICILYHLFSLPPSGGEAVRGYLHGGFLIDFVGVQGPVSKSRLVLGDIWVLGLQWVLLGVVGEVKSLREGPPGGEAEVDRTVEVEEEEERTEKEEEGDDGRAGRGRGEHPLDKFYGGQVVVAEVRVVEVVRRAWWWRDGAHP